jgi:hypothetical protein
MDTIDEYSVEEEFSTDLDNEITEEDPTFNKDEDQSKLELRVKSQSRIDSLQKEIILKNQPTVPLTTITPCEESVSEGDYLRANLRLGEINVSPSPIRNPKISQIVTNIKLRPVF